MKMEAKSTGALPTVSAGMSAAAWGGIAAALLPGAGLLFAIAGALVGRAIAKKVIASEMDPVAEEKARETANEWLQNRQDGETGITVENTEWGNGIIPLSATREYKFTAEEND